MNINLKIKMKLFVGALLVGLSGAFTSKCTPQSPATRPSADEFRLYVQSLASSRRRPHEATTPAPAGRGDAPPSSAVGRTRSRVQEASYALDADSARPRPAPLADLACGYGELQRRHYLPVAFAQAGVLAGSADAATQTLEAGAVDAGHVLAMMLVAACMSGAANAAWLAQLEAAFPGKAAREVACKTAIHATLIAAVINSAYLAFVPLLAAVLHGGGLPSALFAGWSGDEFLTLTKLELLMFVPYNTLAFRYVPPAVRPLTHAAISATFNVAVSAVTLGFFDRWCEEAARLLPW